jgi:deazaflavin-dependent oxidoreductase (nitroreductase family)
MSVDAEYEPSSSKWVRDQVQEYEGSGGTEGTTLRDSGLPVVIITNLGAKSGKIRKTPVMRVEHDGSYAAFASQGGAPTHPYWYHNLIAHPQVTLQDGPVKREMIARELAGAERDEWWARGVAAYPPYADYQKKTNRIIPVFVLEPAELRLTEGEVVDVPPAVVLVEGEGLLARGAA